MKVRVFASHEGGNQAVLRSLAGGISGAKLCGAGDYEPCDVAVIFGMVKWSWRNHPRPVSAIAGKGHTTGLDGLRDVIDAPEQKHAASEGKARIVRKHKGPILVVERGYARRDEYWSLGWNGINGWADHCNEGMPDDRWKALGVDLKPWQDGGEYVVVCGQVPWDVSVQDTDHCAWCREMVKMLRRRDYDVRFRPHPMAAKRGVDYGIKPHPQAEIEGARFAVTWNSNAAVDAIIAGVPVVAMNRGSMAWDMAGHDLDNDPPRPGRAQWAANLAYAQWTKAEMQSGAAWRHIARAL